MEISESCPVFSLMQSEKYSVCGQTRRSTETCAQSSLWQVGHLRVFHTWRTSLIAYIVTNHSPPSHTHSLTHSHTHTHTHTHTHSHTHTHTHTHTHSFTHSHTLAHSLWFSTPYSLSTWSRPEGHREDRSGSRHRKR